jgi:antitoxin component of MazEF toxin-antitoxin module
MPYFTHHFDTVIALHPVGTYNYTVVYLPATIARELPFHESPRLRVEADIAGVSVKGAWQPAGGKWYLMLPKTPLKQADLKIGSTVEVSFRLLPQDQVEIPAELGQLLKKEKSVAKYWIALSPGKQRALAHMVASAKTEKTRVMRLGSVRDIALGERSPPWERNSRNGPAA